MGPYNSLNKQLEYDKNTGEVLNWLHKIKKKVDEIAAHHDICYDMGNDKGVCDRKMVSQLNSKPHKDMRQWSMEARTIINNKQKLELGILKKSKRWRRKMDC